MCLIIFAPNISRARIQKAVLEKAFHRNGDGGGLAYVENGRIRISKAFFEFDDYFLEYQRVRSRIHTGPLLMHMRRGTGGSNNNTNTQPLVIYRGRLVMAHNGVFAGLEDECKGQDISDSVLLSRKIRNMGWDFPFIKSQTDLLEILCRTSSKLVFMDNKNHHIIINEKEGKWWHGAWYSNDTFVHMPKRIKYAKSTFGDGNYSMYPRFPGDNDYIQPDLTDSGVVIGPRLPKTIPPGTRYVDMTPDQKKEYEAYRNRMGFKKPEAPAQFRKHSVIPDIPEKHFGPHTDPDSLNGSDFREWQEWIKMTGDLT